MRVMLVSDQYEPMVGGVPTVTRELAHGLAERGHEVALVVPGQGWRGGSGQGWRGGSSAAGRVRVIRRGSVRWPWYEGMRLGCLPPAAARRLITSFAPDVVHLHSPVTLGAAARFAARRRRVPVIYTNHYLPANVRGSAGDGSLLLDAVFYRYVVGFANRCGHVTAPTATALRLLRERGLRVPSGVLSNGVDPRTYSPGPADDRLRRAYGLPAGRPLILSVGRLSQEKRVDVLLDAVARLDGRGAAAGGTADGGTADGGTVGSGAADSGADGGAVLAIAGAGPALTSLRARARSLGVESAVRFLGHVPGRDLPGLYRLADVFAIASEAELQSLATMEAMSCGLPVVAVDACALRELVTHGENGFLARPGDAASLARHLALICADPELRARMSAASGRIIGAHALDRLLGEWEALYRALAASSAASSASAAGAR
jgi:glycosyltransferase involved in cell wall biosynthesis